MSSDHPKQRDYSLSKRVELLCLVAIIQRGFIQKLPKVPTDLFHHSSKLPRFSMTNLIQTDT